MRRPCGGRISPIRAIRYDAGSPPLPQEIGCAWKGSRRRGVKHKPAKAVVGARHSEEGVRNDGTRDGVRHGHAQRLNATVAVNITYAQLLRELLPVPQDPMAPLPTNLQLSPALVGATAQGIAP